MATLRALIVSFDSGTWIATVRMDGSPAQTVDVPTNRAIAAADMTAGSRAIVDTGDHNHPADAVVTAVWT